MQGQLIVAKFGFGYRISSFFDQFMSQYRCTSLLEYNADVVVLSGATFLVGSSRATRGSKSHSRVGQLVSNWTPFPGPTVSGDNYPTRTGATNHEWGQSSNLSVNVPLHEICDWLNEVSFCCVSLIESLSKSMSVRAARQPGSSVH